MRLNAPKKFTWILSLILAAVSLVSFFITIPVVTGINYWIMGVAWLLVFLGAWLKDF